MGDRTQKARTIADQALDAPYDELLRSLEGIDGPGEDGVGDLAQVADCWGVEQTLMNRDCIEPPPADTPPQPSEISPAPNRMDDANAGDSVERIQKGPVAGADRDRGALREPWLQQLEQLRAESCLAPLEVEHQLGASVEGGEELRDDEP